jgi:hypothetical protein
MPHDRRNALRAAIDTLAATGTTPTRRKATLAMVLQGTVNALKALKAIKDEEQRPAVDTKRVASVVEVAKSDVQRKADQGCQ